MLNNLYRLTGLLILVMKKMVWMTTMTGTTTMMTMMMTLIPMEKRMMRGWKKILLEARMTYQMKMQGDIGISFWKKKGILELYGEFVFQ